MRFHETSTLFLNKTLSSSGNWDQDILHYSSVTAELDLTTLNLKHDFDRVSPPMIHVAIEKTIVLRLDYVDQSCAQSYLQTMHVARLRLYGLAVRKPVVVQSHVSIHSSCQVNMLLRCNLPWYKKMFRNWRLLARIRWYSDHIPSDTHRFVDRYL